MKSWRSGQSLFRGIFEQVGQILLVISMFLLLTVSEIYGKTGVADAFNFSNIGFNAHWRRTFGLQNINGIVFSVGNTDVLRPVLSNQTRSPVAVSLGSIGSVLYCIGLF